MTEERVWVAVDIMNLWYGARAQYGDGVRVDYGRLSEFILSKRVGNLPRNLHLIAYTITSSTKMLDNGSLKHVGPRNHRFVKHLKSIGYKVRNRNLYVEKGSKKPFASDWDVGITVDAMDNLSAFDTFCLVSGDGDYTILLERLRDHGKYVEAITFANTTSKFLYASSNRIIHLTENEIFRTKYVRRNQAHTYSD